MFSLARIPSCVGRLYVGRMLEGPDFMLRHATLLQRKTLEILFLAGSKERQRHRTLCIRRAGRARIAVAAESGALYFRWLSYSSLMGHPTIIGTADYSFRWPRLVATGRPTPYGF